MNIMRIGDQYAIGVELTTDSGALLPEDVTDVWLKVGNIIKKYSEGEITYNQMWLCPLTEAEIGSMREERQIMIQAKVFFPGDVQINTDYDMVNIGVGIEGSNA